MTNSSSASAELIEKLTGIVGWDRCLTDTSSTAPYLRDWMKFYQGRTLAVVKPADVSQVSLVVRACAEAGASLVPQGGNTGLAGGATPDGSGRQVVVSLERLNTIREIDRENATFTVEAGCTLAQIQEAARSAGLLFPLSLGSEGSCQIGGNLATNAGGVSVLHYGGARDLTLGLEVVLADGRVWHGLRGLRKNNTGYDLRQLFIGSEGTLGIITAAVLKLFPQPVDRATALVKLANVNDAVALLGYMRQHTGDLVTAFEYLSGAALQYATQQAKRPNPIFAGCAHAALIEISGGTSPGTMSTALESALENAAEERLIEDAVLASSLQQRHDLWQLRESHLMEALDRAGPDMSCDISVPVSKIPEFIATASRAARSRCNGVQVVPYGHIGDGNIHFDLIRPSSMSSDEFMARFDELTGAVYDTAFNLGGSFSAEHGIGQLKVGDMRTYCHTVELDLMAVVKRALDPKNLLNPGKVLPDSNV